MFDKTKDTVTSDGGVYVINYDGGVVREMSAKTARRLGYHRLRQQEIPRHDNIDTGLQQT